jgi:hypothetical protein
MKKSFFLFALISLVLQSCFVTNSTKLRGNKPLFGRINTVEEKDENIEEKREDFSLNEVIIENKNEEKTSEASNDFASVSNEIIVDETNSKLQLDAGCDKITFLNGNEEEVKLLEIGDDYLKYKRCDNLDGPTFSVSKSKVFMIVYSNGNKEVIDHEEEEEDKSKNEEISAPRYNTQTNYSAAQETNGFAIASFILGILGFIPLAGIILGIVATKQITKNPNRFKGKGFATAGIMLSIFWIMLLMILITL